MEPHFSNFPNFDQAAAPEADLKQPPPAPSNGAGGVWLLLRDLLIAAAASVFIITFLNACMQKRRICPLV